MEQGNRGRAGRRGWKLRFTKGFDHKATLSFFPVDAERIRGTKRIGLYFKPGEPVGVKDICEEGTDKLNGEHIKPGWEQTGTLIWIPDGPARPICDEAEK